MTAYWAIDHNAYYKGIKWSGFDSEDDVLFPDVSDGLICSTIHPDYGYTLVF